MTKTNSVRENPILRELNQRLIDKLLPRAVNEGMTETKIPGVAIGCRRALTACTPNTYEPLLIIFLQGEKRVNIGRQALTCDAMSFLLCSIDMPVASQITKASKDTPHLCLALKLNLSFVREIISKEEIDAPGVDIDRQCMAVGRVTAELLDAAERLADLLDKPQDIAFLHELIHREIVYRVMRTPQGQHLRAMVTQGDQSNRTAKAIAWLKENYARPLKVEELAEMARMGVSTFHHHFRALTALSPLQYQKQLRLLSARERMLAEGADATSAAFAVGYESASQFNREYRRFFGMPPMRDVKARRGLATSA